MFTVTRLTFILMQNYTDYATVSIILFKACHQNTPIIIIIIKLQRMMLNIQCYPVRLGHI